MTALSAGIALIPLVLSHGESGKKILSPVAIASQVVSFPAPSLDSLSRLLSFIFSVAKQQRKTCKSNTKTML